MATTSFFLLDEVRQLLTDAPVQRPLQQQAPRAAVHLPGTATSVGTRSAVPTHGVTAVSLPPHVAPIVRHEPPSGVFERSLASLPADPVRPLFGSETHPTSSPFMIHDIGRSVDDSHHSSAALIGAASHPAAPSALKTKHSSSVINAAADEFFDPSERALIVLEALLETARSNADLTELDLVARRVRQTEIDSLSDAVVLLEQAERHIKKRCNALFNEINSVNAQQAQLVNCLEAAFRSSVAVEDADSVDTAAHRPSSSGAPIRKYGGSGFASPPPDSEDATSNTFSVGQRGRLPQTTASAASSLSGGVGLRGRGGSAAVPAAQQVNSAVSPYLPVVGGPLNRQTVTLLHQ